MANNPANKKTKNPTYIVWRNRPYAGSATSEAARRRNELWQALNAFIAQQGGWVVSLPNAARMRIEMCQGSNLVSKLIEYGYSPTHCGTGTRITPTGTKETIASRGSKQTARLHDGFMPVDIIEITLGK
jgi:hypothetical protein